MIVEALFFALFGCAVGSFLTVVVERLDTVESFLVGRSHCNECKKVLSWWELIPLLGFLLVRGKCIKCNTRIPRIYPLFELISGATFLGLWFAAPNPIHYGILALDLIVASLLLILFFYDWLHQAFPARVLYMGLGLAFVTMIVRYYVGQPLTAMVNDPIFGWLSTPNPLIWQIVLSGGVGTAFLGLLAFPSKGQWMGFGDVILASVLGFWVGYPYIIIAIMLAFYAGAFYGIILLLNQKMKRGLRVPFGPFLIFGAVAVQVWGEQVFIAIMKLWGAQ